MSIGKGIANYLIKEKGVSSVDEQEVLIYGAEVLFSTIFITALTLLIGYLLGLFHPLWIALLTSLIIRKAAGGAHSFYSINCLFITLISYNLMSYLAIKLTYSIMDHTIIVIITTIIVSSFLIIKKAPMETANKPIGINQKKQLKTLSIIVLLILSILQLVLYYNSYYLENFTLCLVLLWQSFMMTQLGYKAIAFFDNFYKVKEVKSG